MPLAAEAEGEKVAEEELEKQFGQVGEVEVAEVAVEVAAVRELWR